MLMNAQRDKHSASGGPVGSAHPQVMFFLSSRDFYDRLNHHNTKPLVDQLIHRLTQGVYFAKSYNSGFVLEEVCYNLDIFCLIGSTWGVIWI